MRRPLGIDVVFEVKVSFRGAFFGRSFPPARTPARWSASGAQACS
jgi:hypothetical protein